MKEKKKKSTFVWVSCRLFLVCYSVIGGIGLGITSLLYANFNFKRIWTRL